MPTVTDWISSIAAVIGGLTGVGALIISFLSYRKAHRALAADAQTRVAVASTFQTVEALGAQDAALRPDSGGRRQDYALAAERTRQLLDQFPDNP
ncbi:MAG TPA: hypothetical protein VNP97_08080 [Microbacterium sp.]|jgi:hypothetical protein|nr:hypothetical protein [Microbacterium sp.]